MDNLEILGNFLPKTRTLHISAKKLLGNARIPKKQKIKDFLNTVQTNFPYLCTIGLGPLLTKDAEQFQAQARAMNWEIFITWEPFRSFS
jgi:hypothetical protein